GREQSIQVVMVSQYRVMLQVAGYFLALVFNGLIPAFGFCKSLMILWIKPNRWGGHNLSFCCIVLFCENYPLTKTDEGFFSVACFPEIINQVFFYLSNLLVCKLLLTPQQRMSKIPGNLAQVINIHSSLSVPFLFVRH